MNKPSLTIFCDERRAEVAPAEPEFLTFVHCSFGECLYICKIVAVLTEKCLD